MRLPGRECQKLTGEEQRTNTDNIVANDTTRSRPGRVSRGSCPRRGKERTMPDNVDDENMELKMHGPR